MGEVLVLYSDVHVAVIALCYVRNTIACIPATFVADLALVCLVLPPVYLVTCIILTITEHQNWFGMDENLGPVAVSIRRERIERQADPNSVSPLSTQPSHTYHYRLLIRTSEVRGYILIL